MNKMESIKENRSNGWSKNHRHLNGAKVRRIIGWVFVGVIVACFFALIFGFLVKWLWGFTLSPLFNLPQPTYWQAVGLIILGKLLFGGVGHSHKDSNHSFDHKKWHDHFEGRYGNKTSSPDWISTDKEHGEYYREFWEKEGKRAFQEYLDKCRSKEDEYSS